MGNSLYNEYIKNCKCCKKKLFNNNNNNFIPLQTSISQQNEPPNFKYNKLKILQLTSNNEFLPQGIYENMENHDILKSFLSKPLVQTYFNELFRPNKNIKTFQYQKIKGIFTEMKSDMDALFKRFKIKYKIPSSKFKIKTFSYKIESNPCENEDLDMFIPLFFLEFLIYPKSFIKNSKIKQIIFVHDIQFTTPFYSQERAGCPEYQQTKSLILAAAERNFLYIRIVMHHEFFHYVDWIDDNSYEDEIFEKLNEPNFKYGNGGEFEREWIKLDKGTKGFINHYSTTGLEEDRAEIYQYLIGDPDEALNNKDEIVRKKVKRIQEFVNKFDPNGMGNKSNNFWGNLIDFRRKFVYREQVYQGGYKEEEKNVVIRGNKNDNINIINSEKNKNLKIFFSDVTTKCDNNNNNNNIIENNSSFNIIHSEDSKDSLKQ
jgi:hypothetical protein